MADESENLVRRLLRETRATQDVHGAKLCYIGMQIDDLCKLSSHALGACLGEGPFAMGQAPEPGHEGGRVGEKDGG
jgi:hypothetical protein